MKTTRKYTHLFFDLDNTLWDFTANSYNAMKSAFDHLDRQLSHSEFTRFFEVYTVNNRLLWDDYRKGNVSKKELVSLRFQKTFDELQIKGINPLVMNDIYLDEMPGQKRLVNGAELVLEYLKSKGYEMYVITNGFKQVQNKKLESSGIRKYFKKVFISEEIMAPKPAPEIFEYALKSSNARKTKSLMIGDDFESDIKGALKYGIDAVFFEHTEYRNGKHINVSCDFANQLFHIFALTDLTFIV